MTITPGPWRIDGGTNKKGDLYVWKDGDYMGGHAIATVHGEIQEGAQDNARLIATTPALLAALKEIIAECPNPSFPYGKRVVEIARAAIAKAGLE